MNEKAQILLAQDGDEQGFEALYDAYYERILNYAFRRVLDYEVAQDVAGNVFMAVAKNLKNFTYHHENSFAGWIFRIASNEVNQYFRKANRYKSVDIDDYHEILPDEREKIEDTVSRSQDFVKVHGYMKDLKPKHQTIIDLFYFEGMSHRSIAEVVEMTEGAVRVALHRALENIRNEAQRDGLLGEQTI